MQISPSLAPIRELLECNAPRMNNILFSTRTSKFCTTTVLQFLVPGLVNLVVPWIAQPLRTRLLQYKTWGVAHVRYNIVSFRKDRQNATRSAACRGASGGGDDGTARGCVAFGADTESGGDGAHQPAVVRHLAGGAELRAARRGCAQPERRPGFSPATTGGEGWGDIDGGFGGVGRQRAAARHSTH